MKSKYQVGDVVKVRDDLNGTSLYCMEGGNAEYGVRANDDMIAVKGEFVEIFSVHTYAYKGDYTGQVCYRVKCKDGRIPNYGWTDEMFEDLPEEPIMPGDLDVLYECFVNKNTV